MSFVLVVAPYNIFDHTQFLKDLPPSEKFHEPPLNTIEDITSKMRE